MVEKENSVDKPVEELPPTSVVSDQERQLTITAANEFKAGKFKNGIDTLNKLMALRPGDPKVLHNKAVASYYLSGCKNTEELTASLKEVASMLQVNLSKVNSLDDVDHCVAFFNHAVVLYHEQQYHQAVGIFDKLFQYMEPLDENLSKKICYLFIELCLCLQQPEKGLGLVAYTENLLFGNKSNENKSGSPEKDKELEKDQESGKEKEATDEATELCKMKLQQYKARCFIMCKSMKASKREIKGLMNMGANVQTVFLRSQLEYLRGNYKKALKVLNTASQQELGTVNGDNLIAMFYNNLGCIHFYMGKPNIGCCYSGKALNEYKTSIDMQKTETVEESSKASSYVDMRLYHQLLYNLGIQYLFAGKYVPAFDCLIEAIRFYPSNPRLWLRIAECCIGVHKSDNSADFQLKEKKKNMVQGHVGSGKHRKIILSVPFTKDCYSSNSSQSSAIPVPTLEFAALCLQNALSILSQETSKKSRSSSTGSEEGDAPVASASTTTTESKPSGIAPGPFLIGGDELISLKNSILVCSSYVSLCLSDFVVAFKHAEVLLSQPRISGVHKALGHLYAAEALLLMDKIPEAIVHLNQELVKDISFTLSSAEQDESKPQEKTEESGKNTHYKTWYPSSVSTAKLVFLYNLAVAYTLRGEMNKATDILRQVSAAKGPEPEIPVHALMLAIYIQLQQGHADLAKSIIKQHLPQYK